MKNIECEREMGDFENLYIDVIICLCHTFRIITESPRWLMSKGRFDEAEKIIQNVAKVNHAKLPEPLLTEEEKQKVKQNCFSIPSYIRV